MNLTHRLIDRRALGMLLLFLGAILWLWFALGNPAGNMNVFLVAKNTRTALALTSDALLGPFPTATIPTATASDLPTITPTIPTATASATQTRTPTPTFPVTATPRTREPDLTTNTATSTPPSSRPTVTPTSVVPTNPPVIATDTTVPPTDPLPTLPLIQTLLPFP